MPFHPTQEIDAKWGRMVVTTMMLWRSARRSGGRDRDRNKSGESWKHHAVMMPCSSSSPGFGSGPVSNSRYPFPGPGQDGCRQDISSSCRVLWNGVGGVADDFRLSCPGAPDCPDLDSDVGSSWLGQDEISEDPDRR